MISAYRGGKKHHQQQNNPHKSSSLIPPFKKVRSILYIHPRRDKVKSSWSSSVSGVSRSRSLNFCLLFHKMSLEFQTTTKLQLQT